MKPIFALSCLASIMSLITPCIAYTKSDFVDPPVKFRSRPLWFWNNTAVTATEIAGQMQGNLMSLVAMNTGTKERVDLTAKVIDGSKDTRRALSDEQSKDWWVEVNFGTSQRFNSPLIDEAFNASVRLRGKIKPESWDPHAGKFSVPEYSHVVEDGQPVTRVKLALSPVHSLFIVANRK